MTRFVAVFVGAMALGIVMRSYIPLGWAFATCLLGIICVLWLLSFRRFISTTMIIVGLCGLMFGFVRMHTAVPSIIETTTYTGGELTGTIVSEPEDRGSYTQFIFDAESVPFPILVRISAYENVVYADEITLVGVLEPVSNFETDEGRLFNYRGFLAKDGVYGILAFPEVVVHGHTDTLRGVLATFKMHYLQTLARHIPEPEAALAGGITVGERRSLGDELTQSFRDTGLIHIVVLSGYNIAIIIVFLNVITWFVPRHLRLFIIVGIITLFTLLVGASATVVRAALMGSIVALGVTTGRTYDALHALFIASGAMMIWNPYIVAFDPSFQLSVIATLGLLVGMPLCEKKLSFVPSFGGTREIVGATVTTYIAVLPLLAYMIGRVSVIAFVTNIAVLPLVPFAMIVVFFTGMFGMFAPALGVVSAWVSWIFLHYMIVVVSMCAQLPFATLGVPAFPFWGVVLAYGVIAMMVFQIRKKAIVSQG